MSFHGVYLLFSRNPKYLGRTYIGYTVDPSRREKQHNKGKDYGGAWKTSNRGPWDMVLIVHGFPNEIAALRVSNQESNSSFLAYICACSVFEWAWQHPKMSRRIQHVSNKKAKEKVYAFCLRVLYEMLHTPPWKRLPLNIQWLKPEYKVDLVEGPAPLPNHMPVLLGPIPPPPGSPTVISPWQKCYVCRKDIADDEGLQCTNRSCSALTHMICLARYLLTKSKEYNKEYIPVSGQCGVCDTLLLWGDLVKQSKSFRSNSQSD